MLRHISILFVLQVFFIVQGETLSSGKLPVIRITGINSSTIKKYEKFEVKLDLANVEIENPYDPENIDVYAHFTTPSGKRIRINGFYDNHENADQWKVRFSPNDNYAEHHANLFAIWDITYGGFVNGTGLIEEEPGRYNQLKLGRIDSLHTILEERDIKLMYAIWPHDLFSETVWAAQWLNNPYSQLIDVDEVYSDSVVWEYQKNLPFLVRQAPTWHTIHREM